MHTLFSKLDSLRPYRLFERPIFVLSAPRSGSSFLYEILSQFPEIRGWHAEMDAVWWQHFPYARLAEPSDHVGADEYTAARGRTLRRLFYRFGLWGHEERGQTVGVREKLGLAPVRYLDKTLANCFHAEFLDRLFPDALFVLIVRDARATVSSMMEGWRDPERFRNRELQPWVDAAATTLGHWAYAVPPGWRAVVHQPLAEVCAWSWRRHVETAREFLGGLPEARRRVVRYEDLVERPEETVRELGDFCGLPWSSRVSDFLGRNAPSRTTVTAPEREKWRRLHGEEVGKVLPLVGPTMAALGYTLEGDR
jgi:hypothetical protein